MRISARSDYACRALLELALHWPNKEPLQIHAISKKQDVPLRYLIQILIQLKRFGLVSSIRGKDGGYNLAKAPNKIKLGKVLRHIGGALLPKANSVMNEDSVFLSIWTEVEDAIGGVLDKVTFEDIANKVRGRKRTIMYSI